MLLTQKPKEHQALLRWGIWGTGAVIFSAPMPHKEAMEIYRHYCDNREVQISTRTTIPTVIVEGTSEFTQATQ